MRLEFTLSCIPPKTTSQQKRLVMVGGKPRFFKKKEMENAEATLAALLQPHRPAKPFTGPVTFYAAFTWPWRTSDSKKVRAQGSAWLPVRPDLDNLVKHLKDVMTSLAFWHDDGQIVILTCSKQVGDHPGIHLIISDEP